MFNKEALKITAFYTLLLATFLVIFSKPVEAQIQTQGNCKEIAGRYFITNEYYRVCTVYQDPLNCPGRLNLTSYATLEQCNSTSVQKYGCSPAVDGKVLYGFNSGSSSNINFSDQTLTQTEASNCLERLKNNDTSTTLPGYCRDGVKFFQCKCSKTLIGETGDLGLVISWITDLDTYSCYVKQVREPFLIKNTPVNVFSPLALIKVSVNLMFSVIALIVIMNLIRVGIMYVQSEGVPDDLKKARELMSNTLQGMVFFLVVVGFITYLTNVFSL
jgi:hypothetical protein